MNATIKNGNQEVEIQCYCDNSQTQRLGSNAFRCASCQREGKATHFSIVSRWVETKIVKYGVKQSLWKGKPRWFTTLDGRGAADSSINYAKRDFAMKKAKLFAESVYAKWGKPVQFQVDPSSD